MTWNSCDVGLRLQTSKRHEPRWLFSDFNGHATISTVTLQPLQKLSTQPFSWAMRLKLDERPLLRPRSTFSLEAEKARFARNRFSQKSMNILHKPACDSTTAHYLDAKA